MNSVTAPGRLLPVAVLGSLMLRLVSSLGESLRGESGGFGALGLVGFVVARRAAGGSLGAVGRLVSRQIHADNFLNHTATASPLTQLLYFS